MKKFLQLCECGKKKAVDAEFTRLQSAVGYYMLDEQSSYDEAVEATIIAVGEDHLMDLNSMRTNYDSIMLLHTAAVQVVMGKEYPDDYCTS